MALGSEQRVELRRLGAQWGSSPDGLRRRLGKPQVFQHQGRRETTGVVPVGWRGWHWSRNGTIGRQRPALTGRGRGNLEELLMVETEFLRQHERFARSDHGDAKQ